MAGDVARARDVAPRRPARPLPSAPLSLGFWKRTRYRRSPTGEGRFMTCSLTRSVALRPGVGTLQEGHEFLPVRVVGERPEDPLRRRLDHAAPVPSCGRPLPVGIRAEPSTSSGAGAGDEELAKGGKGEERAMQDRIAHTALPGHF